MNKYTILLIENFPDENVILFSSSFGNYHLDGLTVTLHHVDALNHDAKNLIKNFLSRPSIDSWFTIRIVSKWKFQDSHFEIANTLDPKLNLSQETIIINLNTTSEYEGTLSDYELMLCFMRKEQFLQTYSKGTLTKNYWFYLNEVEKKCWLELAISIWSDFDLWKTTSIQHIHLDGQYIQSELDLYCAIGEEVHGVLGYMGYNINALKDCLSNFRPSLEIEWHQFNLSKQHFQSQDDLNYCVEILKKYSDLILHE